ncbi:MAG TPA: hypothetical protein VN678_09380 [Acidobacteriaceae bacterium]|nr:hypothetical protein [Acidobacteriaceae bacterium]
MTRLQNIENRKLAHKFPAFCELRGAGCASTQEKEAAETTKAAGFAAGFLSFCIYFIKRGKTKMPLFEKIYLARMEEFSRE